MKQYPQNPFETKLVMMGAELLPERDDLAARLLFESKDPLEREFISEKDKGDYVIRKEKVQMEGDPAGAVEMDSAYTKSAYIGDSKTAKMLDDRGIKPELADPEHSVCSIGFCEKEQKWYGWSHRAIFGFGVGDELTDKDCGGSKGKAKTLADAKELAIAFAASVS